MILQAELIYELNNKPTPQCHASTMVEIDGEFPAAWFGGLHEKHPSVGIWTFYNSGLAGHVRSKSSMRKYRASPVARAGTQSCSSLQTGC